MRCNVSIRWNQPVDGFDEPPLYYLRIIIIIITTTTTTILMTTSHTHLNRITHKLFNNSLILFIQRSSVYICVLGIMSIKLINWKHKPWWIKVSAIIQCAHFQMPTYEILVWKRITKLSDDKENSKKPKFTFLFFVTRSSTIKSRTLFYRIDFLFCLFIFITVLLLLFEQLSYVERAD